MALSECSRIDECQQWADKAEALASYAKQSKDDSLRKMADRIQARAIRRCGELLKMVEPANGARTDLGTAQTRGSTATDAGLSERQRKTALRVANVPDDSFERQVESEAPPTITALAEQGKRKLLDLGKTSPDDFKMATAGLGALRRYTEFLDTVEPERFARGLNAAEAKRVREFVARIDSWHDRLIVSLED